MRIGIDLGGTKTELIALDDSGRELYRKRIPTEREVYSDIVAMIARLVTETETVLRAKGTVGVGIPGAVSARSGLIKNASLIELNGHALDRDLSQALEREVRCVNDANCLAVSEATDGAGKGRRMVFAVIIGTGCGSGISANVSIIPIPTSVITAARNASGRLMRLSILSCSVAIECSLSHFHKL